MKKIEVTVKDGQGMPKTIAVEVPDDATPEEIRKAVEEKERTA